MNDWQAGQSFGPSQVEMAIRGGIRAEVVNIDPSNMKARICVTRQAGRDDREGVLFLGSIAVGDGWVLLKDVLFRVPPKGGPLREVVDLAAQLSELRERDDLLAGLESGLQGDLGSIRTLIAALERRRT